MTTSMQRFVQRFGVASAIADRLHHRPDRPVLRQFALTIAFSTVISAFTSLTLSPALSAVLLKPDDAPKDWLTRAVDWLFGGFFARFNCFFRRNAENYGHGVNGALRHKAVALGAYVLLLGGAYVGFQRVPPGFVPVQDKQYLVSFAQLPDGATLDRTEAIIRRCPRSRARNRALKARWRFRDCRSTASLTAPAPGSSSSR
jgi:multidrug efflux pump